MVIILCDLSNTILVLAPLASYLNELINYYVICCFIKWMSTYYCTEYFTCSALEKIVAIAPRP